MTVRLTIGSLFSGIGGLELGLERAGLGPVVWQVEQHAYCRGELARDWPHARRFTDVRDVGAATLAPVDVICGGFPCQDISDAGKRIGITGARSGLWREYARIVRELRPRYVVVENVAVLRARGLGVILGDLAALGYDAEWACFRAADLGAPHGRDRLFVVAYPAQLHGDGRAHHRGGRGARPDPLPQLGDGRRHADAGRGWWLREPGVGPVAHGIPAPTDELAALGNAVVPQCAEYVGRLIVDHAALCEREAAA